MREHEPLCCLCKCKNTYISVGRVDKREARGLILEHIIRFLRVTALRERLYLHFIALGVFLLSTLHVSFEFLNRRFESRVILETLFFQRRLGCGFSVEPMDLELKSLPPIPSCFPRPSALSGL